jgi:hypothetical protein
MIIVKRWKAAEIGLTNINFFYGFSIYTIIMEKAKAVSKLSVRDPMDLWLMPKSKALKSR